MKISVVTPVYKAEKIIEELVRRLIFELEKIANEFEIILVEDGSPDASWKIIETVCILDKRIKGIKLSRNFGQHYAITAGLDHATGNWIIVMDCDLQDRPEEIPLLYKKAKEGFDIVVARRKERTDGFFKKIFSKLFYGILSYLTGTSHDSSVANFGIYDSKVIQALQKLREPIRYFPTMVRWVGFNKSFVDVEHGERFYGKTTYNWQKLSKLAIDIILANSDKPIRIIVKTGFFISFISIIIGVVVIYRFLMNEITVAGYTSLLVSIWFIGGMVLFVLGLIGLYIGKIFEGVKNRPIYFIDEEINL